MFLHGISSVSQHVVNIAHAACSRFLQNSYQDKAALQAAYMLEQVNNINKEANILETSVENTYKYIKIGDSTI